MKDMSWIYLLLFVVLPLIKQIIEKAGQKKSQKSDARDAEKRFPPIARQRQRQRNVSTDKDSDDAWVVVKEAQPGASRSPAAPSAGRNLGGGWTEVAQLPQQTPLESFDPLTNQPPHPLDVLEQIRRELDVDDFEEDTEDPYAIDDEVGEIEERSPHPPLLASTGPALVSRRSSNKRWKLTRNQLRERLIWREILGPPVSLREKDPLSQ